MEQHNSNIQFLIGEVLQTDPEDNNTYNDDINSLFAVYVLPYGQETTNRILCFPGNINLKQIPVPGEHVLIFRGISQYSDVQNKDQLWYYFPPYSLQFNINANELSGISRPKTGDITQPIEISENVEIFNKKSIDILQPIVGDILIEGRWGNSIRLGSTIKDNNDLYTIQPKYKGNKIGDPIIVLSTRSAESKGTNFVVEDTEKDASSLYVTSTQSFPDFKLSKPLTTSNGESSYKSSQIIGSADRIVLQAKKDIIVLDTKKRVTINTPELKIGDETACEAMVHGDVLLDILMDILNVISAGGVGTAGIVTLPKDQAALINAFENLQYLNSSKYFIKRDN